MVGMLRRRPQDEGSGAPVPAGVPIPPPAAPTPVDPEVIASAAVEVVLRRAIELADGDAATTGSAAGSVPVSVLHQVADELSVPPAALSDALAEYRVAMGGALPATLTGSPSLADRVFGPGMVSRVHRSQLPAEVTADHLRRWLVRRHRLRAHQPSPGTIVAVRRRGMVPELGRRVRAANGTAGLSGMREVRAAVVQSDAGSSLCLVADVRDKRTQSILAGAAVAVGTGAAVTAVGVVVAPGVLAGLPIAAGTGWLVTRLSHRRRVTRVQEEVDLTAGQAAAGALPPTLVSEVAERLDEHVSRRLSARRGRAPDAGPVP